MDAVRYHIAYQLVVCVNAAYGYHARICGRHVPADDGLQGLDDGCCSDYRIRVLLRNTAVSAFSLNDDIYGVESCHYRPGKDGHSSCGYLRGIVETEACAYSGILENTSGDHGDGSEISLLSRLEDEFHAALYLIFHLRENDGCAQQ